MQNIDFAALVKALRVARGLTQEDFARELDVTVGTMNGWENGKHRPVKAQRKRLLGLAKDTGIQVPTTPGDGQVLGSRASAKRTRNR